MVLCYKIYLSRDAQQVETKNRWNYNTLAKKCGLDHVFEYFLPLLGQWIHGSMWNSFEGIKKSPKVLLTGFFRHDFFVRIWQTNSVQLTTPNFTQFDLKPDNTTWENRPLGRPWPTATLPVMAVVPVVDTPDLKLCGTVRYGWKKWDDCQSKKTREREAVFFW